MISGVKRLNTIQGRSSVIGSLSCSFMTLYNGLLKNYFGD